MAGQQNSAVVSLAGPAEDRIVDAAGLFQALSGREPFSGRGVALVVAHPDDETIGFGGALCRMRDVTVVHLTDGAPEDLSDAHRLGFETRQDYALTRDAELSLALAISGVPENAHLKLGLTDKRAVDNLPAIARQLSDALMAHGISVVVTHAYEGGHPDHDSAAFAVWAACQLIARNGRIAPEIVEFPLYRAGPFGRVTQQFLEDPSPEHVTLRLAPEILAHKRRMLAAHATQSEVLAWFDPGVEQLRLAPDYDFAQLPNGGELLYESWGWTLDGAHWSRAVAAAQFELGLARRP